MEVKRRTARSLVKRLASDSDQIQTETISEDSDQIQTETICEFRLLSKHDSDSRLFISEAGAIPILSQSLSPTTPKSKRTPSPPSSTSPSPTASSSCPPAASSTPSPTSCVAAPPPPPSSPPPPLFTTSLLSTSTAPSLDPSPPSSCPLIDLVRNPSSLLRSVKDGLKALFHIALLKPSASSASSPSTTPTAASSSLRPEPSPSSPNPSVSDNTKIQENAVATLFNISISNRELLMSTRGLIDSLSHVLRRGSSPASVQSAAATIYNLLVVDEYRPIIGSQPSILMPSHRPRPQPQFPAPVRQGWPQGPLPHCPQPRLPQ